MLLHVEAAPESYFVRKMLYNFHKNFVKYLSFLDKIAGYAKSLHLSMSKLIHWYFPKRLSKF